MKQTTVPSSPAPPQSPSKKTKIYVVKRDGSQQPVLFDKITLRISTLIELVNKNKKKKYLLQIKLKIWKKFWIFCFRCFQPKEPQLDANYVDAAEVAQKVISVIFLNVSLLFICFDREKNLKFSKFFARFFSVFVRIGCVSGRENNWIG